MTAKTTDFSGLLYYNPAAKGFNPIVSATVAGPTSINEGVTATFDAVAWNIPDGPVYWWISGLTNITTDRITPGLAAEATILNNRSSFTVTVSADDTTASGAQAYTINFGPVQNTALQSKTVTVNDTSQTSTYTLTSDASVNEGSGLTFTASGTNVPDSTYYWTIETRSEDFIITSGSLAVSDNYGSFIVVPRADITPEGDETFTVALRSGSISGPILVTSAAITINDTSQAPTYSYSATQSAANSGSNGVHIDTNPTNDAWAGTVPVGATIAAAGYGTFIVTGIYTPTDPGNGSANWWFVVSPNTSYFTGGTALTFIW